MLRYYRFHNDLPHPLPARPVYLRPEKGEGWPEHCPPIRAANAFGWDVLNPFRMVFLRDGEGEWEIEEAVEVHSDVDLDAGLTPAPQINAWFWERDQQLPHRITDNVYAAIRHQCKISTFLYLHTDPDELTLIRAVPNLRRPWSVIEALAETDRYFPAHPWHTVIELPRIEESTIDRVVIEEGEPLCRLITLPRAEFAAAEMTGPEFGRAFASGQAWLSLHGRGDRPEELDIRGAYAKEQRNSTFAVQPADVAGGKEKPPRHSVRAARKEGGKEKES